MGFCIEAINEAAINMYNHLVIRIRANAGENNAPMQWFELDAQGHFLESPVVHEGDWAALKEWLATLSSEQHAAFKNNVVLLLPGTLATLYRVPVNQGQKKHLNQAVPFLLEELLAANVEAFHFSHHLIDNHHVDIAVVAKQLMQQIIDFMGAIHIEPIHIFPEEYLHTHDDTHTLKIFLEAHHSCVVCHPENITKTLDINALLLSLPHLLSAAPIGQKEADHDKSNTHNKQKNASLNNVVIYCNPHYNTTNSDAIEQYIRQHAPHITCTLHHAEQQKDFIHLIVTSIFNKKKLRALIDFRVGSFYCRKKMQRNRSVWRFIGVTAAIWLTLDIAFQIGSGLFYKNKTAHFEKEMRTLYTQNFPNDHSVVDVKASLERKLRNIKNTNTDKGFLNTLKQAAGATASAIKIKSIDYNESNHRFSMDASAVSYQELNNFVESLRQQGLSVDLASANKDGANVLAKLVVITK